MRLVRLFDEGVRTGLLVGGEVVDLPDPMIGLPGSMTALLALGEDADGTQLRRPCEGVGTRAPRVPDLVLQAADVRHRSGRGDRGAPGLVGSRLRGRVGMVVGSRCRHVPAEAAFEVVAGFTVERREREGLAVAVDHHDDGQGIDTHGPTGPWIVTTDEVGDPQDLAVRPWVNGELRQDGRTADMTFTCRQMIGHLSAAFTLEPGMLITTGTPAGVAAGQDPSRWLVAGDEVSVEIEGVGELTNPVADEPESGYMPPAWS